MKFFYTDKTHRPLQDGNLHSDIEREANRLHEQGCLRDETLADVMHDSEGSLLSVALYYDEECDWWFIQEGPFEEPMG